MRAEDNPLAVIRPSVNLVVVAPSWREGSSRGIVSELPRNAAGAGMTYTCSSPSYWPVNAIHLPSGEYFANTSSPGCDVRRTAVPPVAGAVHRSPP